MADDVHRWSTFQSFVSDIATVVAEQFRELEPAPEPQQAQRPRAFVTDPEKVIWHWPDIAWRVTEDVR